MNTRIFQNKTDMKKIAILMLIISMVACSPKDDQESIKKQIAALKTKVIEANKEIKELQKKLDINSDSVKKAQGVPVKLLELRSMPFEHYFEANGKVEAVNDAFISPEMNGQVKKIYVKEGQRVKKGKVLLKLNTKLIESSIEEVKTGLDLAIDIYEKQKQLWDQGIGTEVQYLKAKNAKESLEKKLVTLKAQMDMSVIKAPFSGIVDDIFLKEGEMAAPGMQVIQMVDLSNVFISADISENYITNIKLGDSVLINFPSYPDFKLKAPVTMISNIINSQNRTFKIKLKVDNHDEILKPNILAILKIGDFHTDLAMVIPSIIMKQDTKGYFVFTVNKENSKTLANKVYIKPGVSYKNQTMIEQGLNEGNKVVVEGYNMLSNGAEVIVIK